MQSKQKKFSCQNNSIIVVMLSSRSVQFSKQSKYFLTYVLT